MVLKCPHKSCLKCLFQCANCQNTFTPPTGKQHNFLSPYTLQAKLPYWTIVPQLLLYSFRNNQDQTPCSFKMVESLIKLLPKKDCYYWEKETESRRSSSVIFSTNPHVLQLQLYQSTNAETNQVTNRAVKVLIYGSLARVFSLGPIETWLVIKIKWQSQEERIKKMSNQNCLNVWLAVL